LNRSGELYLTHTVLNGHYTLRFCVGQTHTEAHHVERAWLNIRTSAGELEGTS
jgi:aromatic-L-amino-acid decarboxylase